MIVIACHNIFFCLPGKEQFLLLCTTLVLLELVTKNLQKFTIRLENSITILLMLFPLPCCYYIELIVHYELQLF